VRKNGDGLKRGCVAVFARNPCLVYGNSMHKAAAPKKLEEVLK